MGGETRFARVLREYSEKLGFDKRDEETDNRAYDMSQRLKLAEMVAADGKTVVADLGTQWGGMSHALKECGLGVVSTEYISSYCKKYIRKVNDEVIRCDSFHLPIRKVDALVSYMFLGQNLPDERRKGPSMGEIFEELSRTADTIYSVDLQAEYSAWFDTESLLEPADIEKRLKEALPDFKVEPLAGNFGLLTECGQMLDRIGFKFTKRKHGKQ